MININKRKNCDVIITVLFLFILINTSCTGGNDQVSQVQLVVFPIDKGYGYKVVHQGKNFIYQPYIPAITGERPFPTYVSARNIGLKVLQKLKSHEVPTITLEELKSEGIRCN